MYNDEILIQGLEELGLAPDEEKLTLLHRYYERMIATNEVMNLTAITEYEDVCVKHFLDSLCLVKAIPSDQLEAGMTIIDIGTGAGFPGIPLKIFFPNLKITLMDALAKRVRFLTEVTGELGLANVGCVHGRAEELSRTDGYREKYDLCVSRAVTRMASLAELCIPFVKKGGALVAYKSAESGEEIAEAGKAISTLGGGALEIVSFRVPQSDLGRSLVVVRKEKLTDRKYPRGGGKPMKAPII